MFLGETLMPVVTAIDISRRARRAMDQNLWFAALYNLCAVPVAVFGFVTPLIAAAGGGHLGAVRMLCSRGVYLGYRL